MSRTINGREALQQLDHSISKLRRSFSDAMDAAETSEAREAEVRSAQISGYRSLTDIRLEFIKDAGDNAALDRLHKTAHNLLDKHAAYVIGQAEALERAAEQIERLETERTSKAEKHEDALEVYEIRVAEVDATLKDDNAYEHLSVASEEAATIAARAHQKLTLARDDLGEKGKPYLSDPLFSYLWKRNFRTPDYKVGAFFRFLDHWVARLCKYDQAYLNYARLNDLPTWLEDHAATRDALAAGALKSLEGYEDAALESAGANELRAQADTLLERIQAIDTRIEDAESRHGSLAREHEQTLRSENGPAVEARHLLEDGLKQTSFPDLRILAAETIDLKDDQIVDHLVKLRAEEMSMSLDKVRLSSLPGLLRHDLKDMESLRQRFKHARYDSPYASFKRSALQDILSRLARRRLNADEAFTRLQRALRRIQPRTQPGFGGRRRSNTLGLPDVFGDVIWEIAKEAGRGSRQSGSIGFPTSRPRPRRRSPRISSPKPRRGGGFKTGGGF